MEFVESAGTFLKSPLGATAVIGLVVVVVVVVAGAVLLGGRLWNYQTIKKGLMSKGLLGVMAVIGVVVIGFVMKFSETMMSPDGIAPEGWLHEKICVEHIWDIWDIAAAIWALCFAFYYVCDYKIQGVGIYDKPVLIFVALFGTIMPIVILLCLLVTIGDTYKFAALANIIPENRRQVAILVTFLLSVFYFFLDGFLARFHNNEESRLGYKEACLLADIPIVVTSLILLLWLYLYSGDDWTTFASGLAGFQLLSSNIIFVMTQAGFLRKIY